MGNCCTKPQERPTEFTDFSKDNGTSDTQKKENKRYTQDPTIPRNASGVEASPSAGMLGDTFHI